MVQVELDPAEVGFDPARLATLDAHFGRYVDEGRLAGWQLVVARHGEVAHASTYGQRDREAGLPVAPDTLWRIYSMTKPITSVAAMMLWEEGRFELHRRDRAAGCPSSPTCGCTTRAAALAAGDRAGHRADPGLAPAHPHLRPHLRLPARHLGGRRAATAPPGIDLVPAPRASTWPPPCDTWAALPLLFQPGTAWGYSVATDVLGRLVEVVSGQTPGRVLRRADPRPARHDRHPVVGRRRDAPPAGRALRRRIRAPAAPVRYDLLGDADARRGRTCCPAAAGWSPPPPTTTASAELLLRQGRARRGPAARQPRTVRLHDPQPPARRRGPRPPSAAAGSPRPTFEGVGFGLGFAVVRRPGAGRRTWPPPGSTTGVGWPAPPSGSTRSSGSRCSSSPSWCRPAPIRSAAAASPGLLRPDRLSHFFGAAPARALRLISPWSSDRRAPRG